MELNVSGAIKAKKKNVFKEILYRRNEKITQKMKEKNFFIEHHPYSDSLGILFDFKDTLGFYNNILTSI